MATRRRAVRRSIITTRSSSSSKTKHKPEKYEHQTQPTTTATQASSTITATTDQNQPCSPSPTEKDLNSTGAEDGESCCRWSTPKAKRFRIPEIETCPPAPRKQRTSSSTGGGINCSLRRSSIPFFTPPELAEFFFRASVVPNMSTTA